VEHLPLHTHTTYGIHSISGNGTVSGGEFTVTSTRGGVTFLGQIRDTGVISGGTFTATGERTAISVGRIRDNGEISGGEFTVTSTGEFGTALSTSYINDNGIISGGKFTVTSQNFDAWGIHEIYDNGEVSGGEFTITGPGYRPIQGINCVLDNGTVSGGTFTITSTGHFDAYEIGVVHGNGTVSGGTFAVISHKGAAYGVKDVSDNTNRGYGGNIFGGEFTVNGQNKAYGIGDVHRNGIVSGGEFTVTSHGKNQNPGTYYRNFDGYGVESVRGTIFDGKFTVIGNTVSGIGQLTESAIMSGGEFWSVGTEHAYGIGSHSVSADLTGGTINVWGPTEQTTTAIGNRGLTGTPIPCYTFPHPVNGEIYGRGATEYTINDAILRGIYDNVPCGTPTTYTITPNAGANGSISPATPQIINEGGTVAFTITPYQGYILDQITVDGNVVTPTIADRCPNGSTPIGGVCTATATSITCPNGYESVSGACKAPLLTCPDGGSATGGGSCPAAAGTCADG